jgi:hypothetical protein
LVGWIVQGCDNRIEEDEVERDGLSHVPDEDSFFPLRKTNRRSTTGSVLRLCIHTTRKITNATPSKAPMLQHRAQTQHANPSQENRCECYLVDTLERRNSRALLLIQRMADNGSV